MNGTLNGGLKPEATALLKLWRTAAGTGGLPVFSDQLEAKLSSWMQDISIVEVHEGPKRFFVRHHGSVTQLRIGDNMTGLYFEDVLTPVMRILALAPYQEAIRLKKPTRSTMVPKLYRGALNELDRIVLPFGDAGEVTSFVTWVGSSERCSPSGENAYDQILALTDPEKSVNNLVSVSVLAV